MTGPSYSVVLPLYNEEENLPELYERLTAVMKGLDGDYELIFVDDGSVDSSAELVAKYHADDAAIKLIRFSRNFGHQPAISAGISLAAGERVVVMDSDLQDVPEDVPRLVGAMSDDDGTYDVVYAIRETRKENPLKKFCYKAFYRLLNSTANIDIPLDSGDFCVMSRKVVDQLNRLPERDRFVRGLRAWVGFRQRGLPVSRDARFAGEPKYRLTHLLNLAIAGFLSFSIIPLRLATTFGFFVSMTSFFSILFVLYLRLFTDISIRGFASTVSILLFLGGVQLFTVGILGEYIGKIFEETKKRPQFVISDTLGDFPENQLTG